jgi:hypothetical protein
MNTTGAQLDVSQHCFNMMRSDVNDEKTPFRIVYEDGDSEWISLQE